jgi:hypothetical protein
LDSVSDDFSFIQSPSLSAGIDKKIERPWKNKSKCTAEFKKKSLKAFELRAAQE